MAEMTMQIKVDPSVIGQTRWHEYAVRFFFGGLFLAFPVIFPASATLIEQHEKERKEEKGLQGTQRGREAASVDAAGAAMGSVGLLAFALLIWQFLPRHSAWMVLTGATVAWLVVSVLTWHVRKREL
jgi:hypothetical protein